MIIIMSVCVWVWLCMLGLCFFVILLVGLVVVYVLLFVVLFFECYMSVCEVMFGILEIDVFIVIVIFDCLFVEECLQWLLCLN